MKTAATQISTHQYLHNILTSQENHFNFNADGLYLKPNNIDSPASTVALASIPIQTTFSWGYDLKLDYTLNNYKLIYLEWIQYRNTENVNSFVAQQIYNEGSIEVPYGYKSDFDIVNFDIGQWINLKNGFLFKFHGGIEYAYLKIGHRFNYTTNITSSTQSFTQNHIYRLIGPRVGLNLDFLINPKIDLLVNSAVNILNLDGDYHLNNNTIIRSGGIIRSRRDLIEDSKLSGIVVGTDIEALVRYKQQVASSNMIFTVGARSIIYLEDFTKWAGGVFGVKWIGIL